MQKDVPFLWNYSRGTPDVEKPWERSCEWHTILAQSRYENDSTAIIQSVFAGRHRGPISLPKQRNSGHDGVPN